MNPATLIPTGTRVILKVTVPKATVIMPDTSAEALAHSEHEAYIHARGPEVHSMFTPGLRVYLMPDARNGYPLGERPTAEQPGYLLIDQSAIMAVDPGIPSTLS